MKKLNILISNDDGIAGAGLNPLVNEMSKLGKVYVIVPEHEMSGTSQSITLNEYKRIKKWLPGLNKTNLFFKNIIYVREQKL